MLAESLECPNGSVIHKPVYGLERAHSDKSDRQAHGAVVRQPACDISSVYRGEGSVTQGACPAALSRNLQLSVIPSPSG